MMDSVATPEAPETELPDEAYPFGRRHARWAKRIDRTFSFGADRMKLCGAGKPNNLSARVADLFFVACACCVFYRGVVVGAALSWFAAGAGLAVRYLI